MIDVTLGEHWLLGQEPSGQLADTTQQVSADKASGWGRHASISMQPGNVLSWYIVMCFRFLAPKPSLKSLYCLHLGFERCAGVFCICLSANIALLVCHSSSLFSSLFSLPVSFRVVFMASYFTLARGRPNHTFIPVLLVVFPLFQSSALQRQTQRQTS